MSESITQSTTLPKPFVFTLMPFEEAFDDTYLLGIKPACEAAGTYCERVDEQIFQESILSRIYNQISKADVIVADMTGRNPNVYYETGYAHGLGKRVILLTQKADDIPFDLKHYQHIVYGGKISELRDDLEQRVRWFLENPDASVQENQLSFFVSGNQLSAEAINLEYDSPGDENTTYRFQVDVHNPTNKMFDATSMELGLILPLGFTEESYDSAQISPDNIIINFRSLRRMIPKSWQPINYKFKVTDKKHWETYVSAILRVLTPYEAVDYPITIKFPSYEDKSYMWGSLSATNP